MIDSINPKNIKVGDKLLLEAEVIEINMDRPLPFTVNIGERLISMIETSVLRKYIPQPLKVGDKVKRKVGAQYRWIIKGIDDEDAWLAWDSFIGPHPGEPSNLCGFRSTEKLCDLVKVSDTENTEKPLDLEKLTKTIK